MFLSRGGARPGRGAERAPSLRGQNYSVPWLAAKYSHGEGEGAPKTRTSKLHGVRGRASGARPSWNPHPETG